MTANSTGAIDREPGILARSALALTGWTGKWVPDAFGLALIATVLASLRHSC